MNFSVSGIDIMLFELKIGMLSFVWILGISGLLIKEDIFELVFGMDLVNLCVWGVEIVWFGFGFVWMVLMFLCGNVYIGFLISCFGVKMVVC